MQLGRYVLMDLENDRKTVAKESELFYNEFNTLIRESENNTTEPEIEENKEETEHVVADLLDEAAIAGAALVSDDNTVERHLLHTHSLQANLNRHWFFLLYF